MRRHQRWPSERKRGKGRLARRRQKEKITDFEMNKKIIQSNSRLSEFYFKKIEEISKSGQKNPFIIQQMAIKLTKEFAKENNMPWRI